MNRNLFKKRALWFVAIFMILAGWAPDLLLAKEPLQCPQPRFTQKAPEEIYNLKNPLESTAENLQNGKMLYQTRAKPMPCKLCHGVSGDGRGPMARGFNPPPRDFTCSETINGVPDGQLFWIIKNGSPGTGMLAYKSLKDEQIWQVLLYVRQLAQ